LTIRWERKLSPSEVNSIGDFDSGKIGGPLTPKYLSSEEIARLKKDWGAAYHGLANAHKIKILKHDPIVLRFWRLTLVWER
jgi:hypothetical protein